MVANKCASQTRRLGLVRYSTPRERRADKEPIRPRPARDRSTPRTGIEAQRLRARRRFSDGNRTNPTQRSTFREPSLALRHSVRTNQRSRHLIDVPALAPFAVQQDRQAPYLPALSQGSEGLQLYGLCDFRLWYLSASRRASAQRPPSGFHRARAPTIQQ